MSKKILAIHEVHGIQLLGIQTRTTKGEVGKGEKRSRGNHYQHLPVKRIPKTRLCQLGRPLTELQLHIAKIVKSITNPRNHKQSFKSTSMNMTKIPFVKGKAKCLCKPPSSFFAGGKGLFPLS